MVRALTFHSLEHLLEDRLRTSQHIAEEKAKGMHWESHLKWGKDLKKKDGMITSSTSRRKFDSSADSMTQEESMQIMPNWSIGPDLYSSTWGSNLNYAVFSFLSINPTKSFFSPEGFSSRSFIFVINFYWSIVALQCCVSFYCTAKRIHHNTRVSSPFGLSSHSDHHSALSRVPCAIQYVLISYLFYA